MADQHQTDIRGLVEQIEEFRHTVSVRTYDLLRKKRRRESNRKRKEIKQGIKKRTSRKESCELRRNTSICRREIKS